jgi:hypothetical protein
VIGINKNVQEWDMDKIGAEAARTRHTRIGAGRKVTTPTYSIIPVNTKINQGNNDIIPVNNVSQTASIPVNTDEYSGELSHPITGILPEADESALEANTEGAEEKKKKEKIDDDQRSPESVPPQDPYIAIIAYLVRITTFHRDTIKALIAEYRDRLSPQTIVSVILAVRDERGEGQYTPKVVRNWLNVEADRPPRPTLPPGDSGGGIASQNRTKRWKRFTASESSPDPFFPTSYQKIATA